VVCKRDIAGFGASGRNGGWCSALFPASLGKLERMAGRDAAVAMYRAMQATGDEVGQVTAAEGIDCHWAKGGTVQLARSATQLERAGDEVAQARSFGFGRGGPSAAVGRGGPRSGGRFRSRGRHLHPALRGDQSLASRPGAGRRGAAAWRLAVRAHPVLQLAPDGWSRVLGPCGPGT
jgi:hypothetical protein